MVRSLRWIVPVLVVPSFGLLCLYSIQFLPTLGLQSRELFLRAKTAFREDFVKLDRVLPTNCSLFVMGSRADNVYSPRPVIDDIRDWPSDREVFLFDASGESEPKAPRNATLGRLVYENPEAVAWYFALREGARRRHTSVSGRSSKEVGFGHFTSHPREAKQEKDNLKRLPAKQ